MGGHFYYYFVPYQEDINSALQALCKQEFEAGRYNPAIPFPFDDWPSQAFGAAQGAKHASIEAAIEASEADGTRSILDMERVGTRADYGVVVQLPPDKLNDLYKTTRPTHQMIKENMDFFEEIERGQGIYIVVYKDDRPFELFFARISYD
jgi:hypothetical protein